MNRIRVLQIGKYYHPYRGGFESSLYTLVNELKDKLNVCVLVSHIKPKTTIEKIRNLSVIRLASFGRILSQPITPMLPFWIKRLKADIIHLHLPNPLAMISYLIVSPEGKLIISYHNDIIRQKIATIFLMPLLAKILHKADAIVATSENLINSSLFLKKFRQKCHIIPHGIDIERFKANSEVLKKSEKLRSDINKPIILFVGRLVYYKGLKYLIKAMKNIDAKLMVIGKGPQQFKLKLSAKFWNVSNKILWLGDIADKLLPLYYHACDLFVLPSCENSESFGLVILEAQAAGKPIISTNLPTGITFTNLHQRTGLVVPPKDSLALAQAINYLLAAKELREEYGQNGRERVRQEFTKEGMAEKILALYCRISKELKTTL